MTSLPKPTLLCQLADAPLSPHSAFDLKKRVSECTDPTQLYQQAKIHGLTPLIHTALAQLQITDALPPKIVEKFQKRYYATLAENMKKLHALDVLRKNLPAHIPLLVLKGPALIQTIYGNPALRPMSDIDLLIQPNHLPNLKECLQAMAFTSPPEYPDIYIKDKITFDLHTDPLHADRIADRLNVIPLNVDHLWQNAKPLNTAENLLMLDLPDQILTLSIHALKHGYERHIWLFDILHNLRRACQSNQWDHVEEQCRKYNCLPILAFTTHALTTHLRLNLPPPTQKIQKSFPIGPIRRKILHIAPRSGNFQILEPLILSRQYAKTTDRVRFLLSFAFPKRAVISQISGLSGRWFWFSYPYRIIQLICLGTLQLTKLIYRLLTTR